LFKFEASWLQEEDCRKIVKEAWGARADPESGIEEGLRGVVANRRTGVIMF
jgi:hypothetical protein